MWRIVNTFYNLLHFCAVVTILCFIFLNPYLVDQQTALDNNGALFPILIIALTKAWQNI